MQTIEIRLDLSEIVYDIQNKTYLTGKCRRTDGNHELVANMQANDDEENANQVLRSVSMAFSTLKTRLGEYIRETDTIGSNELITSDSSLSLTLQMPSNYNPATVDTLAAAAHQYIVSSAVVDWFTITHKSDATEYAAQAEKSLSMLVEAASRRCRPSRPSGQTHKEERGEG